MNNTFGTINPEHIILIIAGLALLVVIAFYFVFKASKRSLQQSVARFEQENADLQYSLKTQQEQYQNLQQEFYQKSLEAEQNQVRFTEVAHQLVEKEQEKKEIQAKVEKQQELLNQKALELNAAQNAIANQEKEIVHTRDEVAQKIAQNEQKINDLTASHESKVAELNKRKAESDSHYESQINLLKENHQKEIASLKEQQAKDLQALAEKNASEFEHYKQNSEQSIKVLEKELRNQSSQLVKDSKDLLLKESSDAFSQLTSPIRIKMEEFAKQAQEMLENSTKIDAQFITNVERFDKLIEKVYGTTQSLDKALRGTNKKMIGNWGEIQLIQLLESCGLQKGTHFKTQEMFDANLTKTKGNLIPDLVVYLPDERQLVIDSKISFNAYVEAVNADDKQLEEKALEELTGNILRHIKELKSKAYHEIKGLKSPSFTIMYVPIDNILAYVSAHRPTIFTEAMQSNVVLASNATLLPLLSIINTLWKNFEINKNTKGLADSAAKFFESLSKVAENTMAVAKSLSKTNKDFNTLVASLSTSHGPLVRLEKYHKSANKALVSLEKLGQGQKQDTTQASVAEPISDFVEKFQAYIPAPTQTTETENAAGTAEVTAEVQESNLVEEKAEPQEPNATEPKAEALAKVAVAESADTEAASPEVHQASPLEQSIERMTNKLKAQQPFMINEASMNAFATSEVHTRHSDSADTVYIDKKESDPSLLDVNNTFSALLNEKDEEAAEEAESQYVIIEDQEVKENFFGEYEQMFAELEAEAEAKQG